MSVCFWICLHTVKRIFRQTFHLCLKYLLSLFNINWTCRQRIRAAKYFNGRQIFAWASAERLQSSRTIWTWITFLNFEVWPHQVMTYSSVLETVRTLPFLVKSPLIVYWNVYIVFMFLDLLPIRVFQLYFTRMPNILMLYQEQKIHYLIKLSLK